MLAYAPFSSCGGMLSRGVCSVACCQIPGTVYTKYVVSYLAAGKKHLKLRQGFKNNTPKRDPRHARQVRYNFMRNARDCRYRVGGKTNQTINNTRSGSGFQGGNSDERHMKLSHLVPGIMSYHIISDKFVGMRVTGLGSHIVRKSIRGFR